jgi:hypothetical protein
MKIKNNSIIDTIIEYANMKFGVELSQEAVSAELKELGLTKTLALIDAIKTDNSEAFLDYVDISVEESGYGTSGTIAGQSAATADQMATVANQQNRQAKLASAPRTASNQRTVAGGAKKATGTRAAVDPDDQQRANNAAGVQQNTDEISRLRSLVQQMTKGQG